MTEPDEVEVGAAELGDSQATEGAKSRGGARGDRESARKAQPTVKAGKKMKGRTIYLDDGLFERIMVQAHRRDKTISEYVGMILERQVPDHRTIRGDAGSDAGAA